MSSARASSALLPATAPWLIVAVGLLVMYAPTLYDLFQGVWGTDEQGHGPIVLIVSIWLLYKKWPAAVSMEGDRPRLGLAWSIILLACCLFALGRSQGILVFEAGSFVLMLMGLVLLLIGAKALGAMWFAFFFMSFMVPLPAVVVDTLTQPMKMAVSFVAENILYAAGYPIARLGVMLHIGQYQLLVADACAGLHTLFTLEAMGLLYLNVVRSSSLIRNVVLAILIVPISFTANVIRVVVLTLVTYHFGDEAGQGFLHGFAGMVLFISALFLIMAADSLVRAGTSLSGRRSA
jgi:exosortase B